MKTQTISIKAIEFENGDIILTYHNESYGLEYFVQVKERYGSRVAIFTPEEMKEIYNYPTS